MMDASDIPINQSVFVAWLPVEAEWCKQDLPHSTIVYAGDTSNLTAMDKNSMLKIAMAVASMSYGFMVKVRGIATFGPEDDQVMVLKLDQIPFLNKVRSLFESWNASEFPYNPHATVGPVGSEIEDFPMYLTFDRILVGWGEDHHIFKLESPEESEG